MGAKVGGGSAGKMDEINVTPLIDVVLVLLIIFMVLTPITVQKMSSNLPPVDPPPAPDTPPPQQLMIAVYKDGAISLNLQEGTDDELMARLKGFLAAKSDKQVFVDADPNANYARVVEVIDKIRAQGDKGAITVGFAEMKEEGPARLQPGAVLPGATPPAAPAPG